jgi:NADH dehydrogenase
LKRIADAAVIRKRILLAFEQAELVSNRAEQIRLLTFVIIGGGATGVEMAGAIAEIARDTLRHDFRLIDPAEARVVLVEAGQRLLPALPEDLSAYALAALGRMGVDVRLDVQVTGCDEGGADTSAGRIEAGTLIWAAGVRASSAASWIGVAADRHGRIAVATDLSVPEHPEIYAIGDTAAAVRPDGGAVPGVAPAAKQMGAYAARVIAARLAGRAAPPPFRYRHAGELATIGRGAAVVRLASGVQLTGLVGWLFWGFVHVYFLISLRARFFVALDWLWSYVTYHRGARLITGD